MQLIRLALLAAALLQPCLPASACALALGTSGILKLSANGQRLGSDETGGAAATLTISNGLLEGNFRLTIARPTVTGPAGFDSSAAQTFVSYSSAGLLSAYNSPGFLSQSSSFDVTGLLSALLVVMTIHNRITTSQGFSSGHYETKTVVTCSSL